MKVLFISERLGPPFDEGIKNVAVNLLRRLIAVHEVRALTVNGADIPELQVENLPRVNRLLLDAGLRARIRAFQPDCICYLPTASMTLFAFLRAWILKRYGRDARVSLIALQPRRQSLLSRLLVPRIAPARIIVQSQASADRLSYLGDRVHFVPAGVDMMRFRPASETRRQMLRDRHTVGANVKVILHAGHVNRNRNVQMLEHLARLQGVLVILVGSSSTQQDLELIAELREMGVRVITTYMPHIEELYQLADLYVFPPSADASPDQTPAIEVPLSVLETMSCALPVATTRFGGLPSLFGPGDGVLYVIEPDHASEWVTGLQ